MRELQFWEDEGGLDLAFSDISGLAIKCRFSNCSHEREEGCAVLEAVQTGELEEKRLINYRKTQREVLYQNNKEAKLKRKSAASTKVSSSRTRGYGWRKELDEY